MYLQLHRVYSESTWNQACEHVAYPRIGFARRVDWDESRYMGIVDDEIVIFDSGVGGTRIARFTRSDLTAHDWELYEPWGIKTACHDDLTSGIKLLVV